MIFVVEDDPNIRELVTYTLQSTGFDACGFENGSEFLKALSDGEKPELVLLDIMLPGEDGISILGKLRKKSATRDLPIIMMTAKGTEYDKVLGLDSGADDYITKPFDINEVIARVQIQLRHAGQEPDRIECGGIALDDKTHQIWVDGQEILHLTRQEYAILELLIRHPKQVFRKEAIFTYAWEEEYMGETKTLDVHISNIRKKLKAVTDKEYIQTVWGIGYRLNQ